MNTKKGNNKSYTNILKKDYAFIISISIALLSTIIYAIVYLYENQLFRAWNIPISFMDIINKDKYIYVIVFSVIHCVCLSVVCTLVIMIVSRDVPFFRICSCLKTLNKKSHWPATINHISEAPEVFKNNRKEYRRAQMRYSIISILSILILTAFALLTGAFVVFTATGGINKTDYLIISAFNMAAIIFYIFITIKGFPVSHDIIKIREKVKESKGDEKKIANLHRKLNICLQELYKKKRTSIIEVKKEILTKNRIRMIVISCVLSIIFAVVLFIMIAPESINNQKSFWIYQNGDDTYIVLQLNSNKAVLKNTRMEEDAIEIDLSSNKLIDIDNIEMKYQDFKKVTFLR